MLSSVLHSVCSIHVNIEIMRAFVRLWQMLTTNTRWPDSLRRSKGSTTPSSRSCLTLFVNS
jgi:hypothetical protein